MGPCFPVHLPEKKTGRRKTSKPAAGRTGQGFERPILHEVRFSRYSSRVTACRTPQTQAQGGSTQTFSQGFSESWPRRQPTLSAKAAC
jgi:hypothetical protein